MTTPELRATLRRIDRQFEAIRSMPVPIPERERYRHTIEKVGAGDYIRIRGEIYRVEEDSRYVENKKSSWFELELF